MNKFKFWFFKNYWWCLIGAFCIFLICLFVFSPKKQWEYTLSGFTIFVTSFFFIQKQKIEELKLFKELFTEFNQRYDTLNGDLSETVKKDDDEEMVEDDD